MNDIHDLHDRVRGTLGTHRGEHYGKGPRNWNRSDKNIRNDVCEALYFHPEIDASEIEVKVQDGIVILSGAVRSRGVKKLIENCAESVSGVRDIRNEIQLIS